MINKKEKLFCDLCAKEITGEPVVKEIDGVSHNFCCGGCARAYENAHENKMLSEIQPAGKDKMASPGHKKDGTAYFSVNGMWCAGCAAAAENVLRNQDGISDVDISFAAERGRLKYDSERVDIEKTLQHLDKLGYSARLLSDEQEEKQERQQEKLLLQLITAMAFSMQVMFFYIERLYPLYNSGQVASTEIRNVQYLVWGLSTPVLFIGGISILKGAWRAMVARTATMDTLVALGALSAYFYSIYQSLTLQGETYFDSVAMITTFIILGRYLEKIGGNQARKDIRRLISLQPQKPGSKRTGTGLKRKRKKFLLTRSFWSRPENVFPWMERL